MKQTAGISRRRWGWLVGGALTLAGGISLLAGWLDALDQVGLDTHFRLVGTIEADPQIVLVDINDHALRTVGEWPWHRRRYAELVDVLHELGARAIVLDLILADPSAPRVEHAALGSEYDVDRDLTERGDRRDDPYIYDDDELREAMIRAGSVYLAMFARLASDAADGSAVRDALAGQLASNFALNAEALGNALPNVDPIALATHLPAAKRRVAFEAATRLLAETPGANFATFRQRMLAGTPADTMNPDRKDLARGYRAARSWRSLNRLTGPAPASGLIRLHDPTLPVDKLAEAARGIGLVAFPRGQSGGVVRDVPIAANIDGTLALQLGALVAADILGLDRTSVAVENRHLTLGIGNATRRLPVDAEGLTPINWHKPPVPGRWQESFDHLPVTRVLEIAANRTATRTNGRRLGIAMGELVELRHADTPIEFARYADLINRRRAATPSPETAGSTQLDTDIDAIEQEALLWLRRAHTLWVDATPGSTEERAARARILELHAELAEGTLARQIETANEGLRARNETLMSELGPRLAEKICLIGYTASGQADLISAPIYRSVPGVMAHANIINMMLQNRTIERAPHGVNFALVLAFGLAVTGVTTRRRPLPSLVMLAVAIAAVVGLGAGLFAFAGLHVASLPMIAVMLIAWAGVTTYRQFTEEHARRRFQGALAQYTSPAVAASIAARATTEDLAPAACPVTCFFSDLQGFTSLSERLGPQHTRDILNPYLEELSDCLTMHGAIVNKFIGDGVFAFFNAPILACRDHPTAGCHAALDARDALAILNRTLPEPLTMRVGLSTGEAFVGDYGSRAKLDYTCIGDTVNLGSRLEAANKPFGTTILVDGATRDAAGDAFVFRSLGRLVLAGKSIPVAAYELLARAGEIDDNTRAYITRFEQVIRHYQGCEWGLCQTCLDACEQARPDDPAVKRYARAVDRFRSTPPPADWDQTIAIHLD